MPICSAKNVLEGKACMNDFTRNELWSLIALINDTNPDSVKWNNPVYIKIQSLIENYCEHSSKQYYDKMEVYECNNCHMVTL